jgi:drug/metabolite transporter (DMT)-like permease
MTSEARAQGPGAALLAALLFGCSAPAAKWLLADIDPWLLAGLLYAGSGLGLAAYRLIARAPRPVLAPHEMAALLGAILTGGIVAPVLLMYGLRSLPASSASLLLNAESVLTALLAWFAFREHFDRRVALGMLLIACGAIALTWPSRFELASLLPALAVIGACFCWAIDNNLMRRVAHADATFSAAFKGIVAGAVNLALAFFFLGAHAPAAAQVAGAMLIGLACYGVSLVLFIVGLRHLGTARTGAYFSVAPFAGAVLSIMFLNESADVRLVVAGALMGLGVWLHLTERHSHEHVHEEMEHTHEHTHDEHHQHEHGADLDPRVAHTHRHRHEQLAHRHLHYPDAHHRHDH